MCKVTCLRQAGHRHDLQLLSIESDAIHGQICLSKIPPEGHSNQLIQDLLGKLICLAGLHVEGTKKIRPSPWPQVTVCLGRQDSLIKGALGPMIIQC